jgi:hypothetical protein
MNIVTKSLNYLVIFLIATSEYNAEALFVFESKYLNQLFIKNVVSQLFLL